MSTSNIINAIRGALHHAMATDPRVVVLGEDVGARGGVFRATQGLLEEFGEERVIDMPLAENAIIGVAIGMALDGLRPIAEIEFADFIHPAFDQIVSEAARMRYRSGGDASLPLVIRVPWGGGVHGGLYHSQSIESFYAHVPGLKVVAPSTPADAAGLLHAAIADPDPVLFLEHKATYRLVEGDVEDPPAPVPIGPVRIAREGVDLSVFAYGLMLHRCLEAAERLARDAERILERAGERHGRGVLGGGRRRAQPLAAGPRRDRRVGPPDRQGARGPRGQPVLRCRRRDRRHDRGGRALRPRRTHRASDGS